MFFLNRSSGFGLSRKRKSPTKRLSHGERFRTAADRSAAETMLLISSTEPNTANAVDVIVSDLIDTNKETAPLLPSVDNTEYSSKSEPSDVDKEQNNEVKILKNKYHPQHWLYVVQLMEYKQHSFRG